MSKPNAAQEDWELLRSFFPVDWRALAQSTGALKGLRQDKSAEDCLRVLLLHLGCGYSLRETVVRAEQAGLAELSDVALLKRLRKSKEWLCRLCGELFAECGIKTRSAAPALRLIDATVVKEPGPTGSLWRVHYSLRWPELRCDYFKLTATEGGGTGESLQHYPIAAGDLVVVDRGYCQASGIHFVAARKAWVTVRLNPQGIVLQSAKGGPFALLDRLATIQRPGQIGVWNVRIPYEQEPPVSARLCVVRKSEVASALAIKKLKRRANKHGMQLLPETLVYARYVMVLTTLPTPQYPATVVLEWYRFRWQIELVFKRFKSTAQLGHLPKHDEDSAHAWLYGKLLVALLTEKVIRQASAFSPWGYSLPGIAEPLA
jgi:hypothetical protein